MAPEDFFRHGWTGQGAVQAVTGRVLRHFEVRFESTWSEPHAAYHLDEAITYADGRTLERHWVVHRAEDGGMIASDSQAGRMTVRRCGAGLRLRYDRPRALGRTLGVSALTLDLLPRDGGQLEGRGVTRWLGLPLVRTRLEFIRTAEVAPAAAAPLRAWPAGHD